jgi:glyceraldehyde-3-phosphate dehydrogenase/erythrose-4-phosphate dehydrogenase
VLRAIVEAGRSDIEVVGINDLAPVETNAHLLRFAFPARWWSRATRSTSATARSR